MEGDLSTNHNDLDSERYAQIQAEELSYTLQLHIKLVTVEHYKDSIEYQDELGTMWLGCTLHASRRLLRQ